MNPIEAAQSERIVLCAPDTCLECDRIRVLAFDDLVAALKMYRDSGYGKLFHRASKEARAASIAFRTAVDKALLKAGE